jgi:hypothetical protein
MAVGEERRKQQRESVLTALRGGNTRTAAAAYAGISKETLYEWMRTAADFSDAVSKAEADAEVRSVAHIIKAAGDGSWQAAAWWLERRRYADWKRQDGIDFSKLTLPQLLALATGSDPGIETAGDRAAQAEAEPGEVSG